MTSKIIKILIIIIFSRFLISCKNKISKDEEEVLKLLDECKVITEDKDSVTCDVLFYSPESDKVTFVWKVDKENVVTKEGAVTRQENDEDVKVTVTASYKDISFSKTFTLKVLKKEKMVNTGEDVMISGKFDNVQTGDKPIIEGWDVSSAKKGAYDTGWTSFRTDGEYVTTALFSSIDKIDVKFIYYLNNVSTNGNKSSKIKIMALDERDNVVDFFLSSELNDEMIRSSSTNPKEIMCTLEGNGIVKVKVLFVKDGGGNIGFSLIEVRKAK